MIAEGMVKAIEHAERETPGWKDWATEFLVDFSKSHSIFLAEDVVTASVAAVPPPPDNRAWGGVFNSASRKGLIVNAGFARAKSSNNSFKALWSKPNEST